MRKACQLLYLKDYLPAALLREIRIYEVPVSRTYTEGIKYPCYLVDPENGAEIIGYGIHPGRGHHRHIRGRETKYIFPVLEELLYDFVLDVQRVLEGKL